MKAQLQPLLLKQRNTSRKFECLREGKVLEGHGIATLSFTHMSSDRNIGSTTLPPNEAFPSSQEVYHQTQTRR
jgi:hypothetical protein